MEFVRLYKCLCEKQRLRILCLLREGPHCVCHLTEILRLHQARVSKELATMRKLGLVTCRREGKWMIYRLHKPVSPLLATNLACLQDASAEGSLFKKDLRRRRQVLSRAAKSTVCLGFPKPQTTRAKRKSAPS